MVPYKAIKHKAKSAHQQSSKHGTEITISSASCGHAGHLAFLGYPIAKDKIYGFKNQPSPKDLKRQFLHAYYLKIKLPDGQEKEFYSELPKDLKIVLKKSKTL